MCVWGINGCDWQFRLVQFSRSVVSDSLQSHGLQHAWPPCPITSSQLVCVCVCGCVWVCVGVVNGCDCQFRLVQFSRSVVSDSLRPHGLQHAWPPCPITSSQLTKPKSLRFSKTKLNIGLSFWLMTYCVFLYFLYFSFWFMVVIFVTSAFMTSWLVDIG